jgi:hypothetical protein
LTEEGADASALLLAAVSRTSGAVTPEAVEAEARAAQARMARAKADDAETDAGLRRWLGYGALGIMATQLVIADAAFFWYGISNNWHIPVAAINVWLGATVVQVVVVVHTVARYLFSARDSRAEDQPVSARPELIPSPTAAAS